MLSMILQRFKLIDFANYQLETKQTLTVKPNNFRIKVRLRAGRTATAPLTAPRPTSAPQPAPAPAPSSDGHQTPLLVLFGSNLGTAEGLAHRIANDARDRGFIATIGSLDEHAGALPKDGGLVVVTASYNGQPPDNAAKFCHWLQDPALPADAFAGLEYSVFGCGNRDWAATYQAIPTLIEAQLEKHGAKPMYRRGEGDARGDFDGDYRAWYAGLWQSVTAALCLPASATETQPTGPRFSVTLVNRQATNPIIRSYSAAAMTVRANQELQHRDCARPSMRSTRHLEVTLPSGVTYCAGDHLGVVPRNGLEQIRRVLLRFELDPSLYITITPRANASTHLPVNEPVPLLGILATRVELQDIATRAQLATLAEHTQDPAQRRTLAAFGGDSCSSNQLVPRIPGTWRPLPQRKPSDLAASRRDRHLIAAQSDDRSRPNSAIARPIRRSRKRTLSAAQARQLRAHRCRSVHQRYSSTADIPSIDRWGCSGWTSDLRLGQRSGPAMLTV